MPLSQSNRPCASTRVRWSDFRWEHYACNAHALAKWDQTIEWCEKSIVSNPASPWLYFNLTAPYAWLGRAAEASAK
jgi:hypothetical protein